MRIIMKKSLKWLLLVVLLFGLVPGSVLAAPAGQERATTVEVTPLNSSVSDCGLIDVYIDVKDVTNLYAVDVRLSFNPAVVEVVLLEGVTGWFNAGFTVRNIVDNFTGTVWYAATQTSPTLAVDGSGHVAHLQLRAKSTASTAFTFTYIKLSNPNGVEIPATGVNGSVSASTSVVPNLGITRLNTTQVQLSWPAHPAGAVSNYRLYRSSTPYFGAIEPIDPVYQVITNPGSGTITFNDAVLGNVVTNYFYAVRAVCTVGGGTSGVSQQVGKFEFELFETTGTDYTWIGLVLNVSGLTNQKSLGDHIIANSNGSVNVKSIGRWNASAQGMSSYIYPGTGGVALVLKSPYRIEIDIPSVSVGSVIWAQVGTLPAITMDTYTLYETTGTDYTWILQPLDMTGISSTTGLKNDIQSQSSAPVGVTSISRWNGTGQNNTTGSFTTRFGYPYRVEVNVNSGFTVTWP